MDDLDMARHIARRVAQQGGRTFFVGGYVRDSIWGRENKDIDIEVHGISPQRLADILDSLGERLEMGASFGVFGLRGYALDIAMPRCEMATGRGHRDFAVSVDPFLGTKKAARRRDFTMNALMRDVLTGELIDHFGGVSDMKNGILRHVNTVTFAEDPLRVLRAAQLAARFDLRIAEETIVLARSMDLSELAGERVWGELQKALGKAERSSVFFAELRRMRQLDIWFPEVKALIGVQQNPTFHPEGDVWNHTMLVLDEAAKLREQAHNPMGLMLTALTHDFGKAVTTEEVDGRIRSLGHETEGLPLVERFLSRMENARRQIRYVCNMTELHMRPNMLAAQHARPKATNKLFDRSVCPEDLVLFSKADYLGRTGAVYAPEFERYFAQRLTLFHETMAQPCVKGADLVSAGLRPGPQFSDYLAYAHKLRLAGVDKQSALRQTLAYAREKESSASARPRS